MTTCNSVVIYSHISYDELEKSGKQMPVDSDRKARSFEEMLAECMELRQLFSNKVD